MVAWAERTRVVAVAQVATPAQAAMEALAVLTLELLALVGLAGAEAVAQETFLLEKTAILAAGAVASVFLVRALAVAEGGSLVTLPLEAMAGPAAGPAGRGGTSAKWARRAMAVYMEVGVARLATLLMSVLGEAVLSASFGREPRASSRVLTQEMSNETLHPS